LLDGLAAFSSGAIGVGSKLGGGTRSAVGAGAIASGSALAGGSVVATDGDGAERGRTGLGARSRGVAVPDGVAVAGRDEAGGGTGRAGVVGAGRVTVPFKVKSCSSRGPMVSLAGVFVVGAVSCATKGAGASTSAIADVAMPKRKPALISSRSLPLNRTAFRRAPVPHGAQSQALQAQLG